ncbi:ribonuclease HII [Gelidibacter maritimus]|uniref:Ribonuclease HII n=1 Tax=Gelidibacter maritimus TaxID=2761487 RepID=A0A7W2M7E9_9FLAO|nr:ribonuclease HII [Gelidibacter maritimus]MBA6154053.1 ribonuclease HII [Gelidibacter maritimus]
MRNICFLLTFILIISCKNNIQKHSNLISLVPNHASVVINTTSIEGLTSVFKNNSLLSQFPENATNDGINRKLNFIKHLKPSEDLLIAFGKDKTDSLQVSVITKYHKDLFKLDSLSNYSVETISLEKNSLTKTTLESEVIYSIVRDSIFFASTDRSLVEAAFKQKQTDPLLTELFKTSSNGETLSVFINTTATKFDPKLFVDDNLNKVQLSNYYFLDADLSQDQLKFDGITIAKDSSNSLINSFKNTFPQENLLPRICPQDSDGFLSFTFHSFQIFHEHLAKFRKQDSIFNASNFESILEAGVIYKNGKQAVVLNSIDASNMSAFFETQPSLDTYREISIHAFDKPEFFLNIFSPLITYTEATKFINIDDFFVFSDDLDLLKDVISSYQNNATLHTSPTFEAMMDELSDESSLFAYANANHLKDILNSNFETENPIITNGFNASAVQFVYENDFAHVHAILQKNKKKTSSNTVYEDVNVTLDADVLTNPQFVNNHTNGQMEVVVQDINNHLYLISKDGKVQWKKQLHGKILGKIEQIDINKNGRLQLVFATAHRVYVLDRNGRDVGAFPLKFRDQITQPLSVFDYDKNRNYRLMVTQGAAILLYNKQGKIVRGFNYKKAENTIATQPQHLRIGRKDYIVFVQGNELEILSRVGKTRVKVKNNLSFSDSGVYLYNNKFTTTTVKGDLVQIDANGKMSSRNLNLGEKHGITATSKTLVTLSENILHIKTHKVELDFGEYTPPKIFYVNNKIYVSVTDLQAKKVYLFDSLGKPIDNFPVYGNSTIDLDNIDKGKRPEFVTKGDQNSIIIYRLE